MQDLLTSVLLLKGSLTEDGDRDLEREHAHVTGSLAGIKRRFPKVCTKTDHPLLPVVYVEQPVEREVEAEGHVDGGGVRGRDGLVEGGENGDHVRDVKQLVVLGGEEMG